MSCSHLSAPTINIGKRSRSNSSSSSSSSSGASIISRLNSTDSSSDSLSTYSSPAGTSEASSPYSSGQEEERPCKTLKTEAVTLALNGLERKCSLNTSVDHTHVLTEPERPILATCGKSFFVDCLVESAVHILDVIWDAPLERSLAFVCEEVPSASNFNCGDITRVETCPTGINISQQSIPLELFVRETLRRSRTSCSTLQAALLFCKRVGVEVVRRRAQAEGTILAAEYLEKLSGLPSSYPSLLRESSFDPQDYIFCNRRIFLASIMVSSKFLQDRTFSNRAWSKISGLNVQELGRVERRLLKSLDYDLNVRESTWIRWTNFLKSHWKARPMARNGLLHSNSVSAAQVVLARNALARTHSLPEVGNFVVGGDVVEADLTLPTGDGQGYTFDWPASSTTSLPLAVKDQVETTLNGSIAFEPDVSTPTISTKLSASSGDSTPTPISNKEKCVDVTRKAGQSLLSAALYNHHIQTSSS